MTPRAPLTMDLRFLTRVRHSTYAAGGIVALFGAVYHSYASGLGIAAGAAWSLANLWLLERLVTSLTGPARSERRAWWVAAANLALFAGGAFLLQRLPVAPLMIGFTLPFAVLLLKACSSVLLGSRAWRRITASPWQAVALVALLGACAWFAVGPLTRAAAQSGPAHGTSSGVPADPAAGEPHAATPAKDEATGEHAEPAAGPKEFPNLVSLVLEANHAQPWVQALLHVPGAEAMTPADRHVAEHKRLEAVASVAFAFIVALLLVLVTGIGMSNPKLIPGGLQNAVEALVEQVYDRIVDILGPKYGPRYVPFLGSLFVYIFAMNLFGIFPLMKSPTASLNVTFALAITVFVYVQFTAIKENGLFGWLDHMAGNPRSAIEWGLVPLAFPIHVIGELAKPVSLSCRLFGNIFGEDMLLVGFATLGIGAMSAMHLGGLPFGLPLHFVFLFLVLLTSFVQALVFSMLSTIYFLLMLPHDHGHEHAEAAHHHAH